jgi:hypothetical protein
MPTGPNLAAFLLEDIEAVGSLRRLVAAGQKSARRIRIKAVNILKGRTFSYTSLNSHLVEQLLCHPPAE